MNLNITARHFEVSDQLKDFTEKKFHKLEHYQALILRADIVLSDERGLKIAEGKIGLRGNYLIAKTKSHDIYLAIAELATKLLKQVKTFDGKLKSKKRLPRVGQKNE